MNIQVLTTFPEMFAPVTDHSILGKAVEKGLLKIDLVNIRDYTLNKHNKTDDTPYGGGPGMVMSPEPIFRALEALEDKKGRTIYLSPKGRLMDKDLIYSLAKEEQITILCGHYEGVDQRVLEDWNMEEVSIGDYVLTGGELPAMVLMDAVARLVPGVIGSEESHEEESIYSGLLEYPQYTKPSNFRGLEVPEVLLSGNHGVIELWRFEQSLLLTGRRRPDLLRNYLEKEHSFTKKEKAVLDRVLMVLSEEKHGK